MRISWDEARGIVERAASHGRMHRKEVKMPHLAADEKANRKSRHFVTLLMALDRGCIHGTAPGNGYASFEALLKGLPRRQKSGVQAIAMDMHDLYRAAVESSFPVPLPPIVHERFRIVILDEQALNDVRNDEARELAAEGRRDVIEGRQTLLSIRRTCPQRMNADSASGRRPS